MSALYNAMLPQLTAELQRHTSQPGNEAALEQLMSNAIVAKMSTGSPPSSADPQLLAAFNNALDNAHRYMGYGVQTSPTSWLVWGGLAVAGVGLLGGIYWLTR